MPVKSAATQRSSAILAGRRHRAQSGKPVLGGGTHTQRRLRGTDERDRHPERRLCTARTVTSTRPSGQGRQRPPQPVVVILCDRIFSRPLVGADGGFPAPPFSPVMKPKRLTSGRRIHRCSANRATAGTSFREDVVPHIRIEHGREFVEKLTGPSGSG